MTIEEKIKDIIFTMVEEGMIDPKRALVDEEYLIERVSTYIEARNLAYKMFKEAGMDV